MGFGECEVAELVGFGFGEQAGDPPVPPGHRGEHPTEFVPGRSPVGLLEHAPDGARDHARAERGTRSWALRHLQVLADAGLLEAARKSPFEPQDYRRTVTEGSTPLQGPTRSCSSTGPASSGYPPERYPPHLRLAIFAGAPPRPSNRPATNSHCSSDSAIVELMGRASSTAMTPNPNGRIRLQAGWRSGASSGAGAPTACGPMRCGDWRRSSGCSTPRSPLRRWTWSMPKPRGAAGRGSTFHEPGWPRPHDRHQAHATGRDPGVPGGRRRVLGPVARRDCRPGCSPERIDGWPGLWAIVDDRAYCGLQKVAPRKGLALDIKRPPEGASSFVPLRPVAGPAVALLRGLGRLGPRLARVRATGHLARRRGLIQGPRAPVHAPPDPRQSSPTVPSARSATAWGPHQRLSPPDIGSLLTGSGIWLQVRSSSEQVLRSARLGWPAVYKQQILDGPATHEVQVPGDRDLARGLDEVSS